LRTLAHLDGEVKLDVEGRATQRSVLDALEACYPALRGTIRDHVTQQRRPFVRFFACEQDLSHEPPDAPLPDAVATGAEPLLVVGALPAAGRGQQKVRCHPGQRGERTYAGGTEHRGPRHPRRGGLGPWWRVGPGA